MPRRSCISSTGVRLAGSRSPRPFSRATGLRQQRRPRETARRGPMSDSDKPPSIRAQKRIFWPALNFHAAGRQPRTSMPTAHRQPDHVAPMRQAVPEPEQERERQADHEGERRIVVQRAGPRAHRGECVRPNQRQEEQGADRASRPVRARTTKERASSQWTSRSKPLKRGWSSRAHPPSMRMRPRKMAKNAASSTIVPARAHRP